MRSIILDKTYRYILNRIYNTSAPQRPRHFDNVPLAFRLGPQPCDGLTPFLRYFTAKILQTLVTDLPAARAG